MAKKPRTSKELYPELWAAKEKLDKEKTALVAKAKPLRDQMDKHRAAQGEINKVYRPIRDKYLAIIRPRLPEIDRQLSGIAAGESTHSGSGLPAREPVLISSNRIVMQVFLMTLSSVVRLVFCIISLRNPRPPEGFVW